MTVSRIGIYAERIRQDDMNELCWDIVEIIGMKAFINLINEYGGTTVYFPKSEAIAVKARDRIICEEFNGENYSELAKRHNLSEAWIRKIINNDRENRKSLKSKNQR